MHKLTVILLGVCGLVACKSGSLLAGDVDKEKLAQIPVAMKKFVDKKEIAGAVTVVGTKDGIVEYDAVGLRDIAGKKPMTKETVFRIASMTKPVTAIAVMILVDQGKLKVEDEVEKHLPEFRGQIMIAGIAGNSVTVKQPNHKITVRDLLTHTSGLGGLPPGLIDLYVKRDHTLAEAVMAFSQRPLEFEPGTRWAYCNPGIDTLGRIVEVVSGTSYERFLQERIFEPLGMIDTTFRPTREQFERAALLYASRDGRLAVSPDWLLGQPKDAKYPIPAGGLYSTGADLARLYRMMLGSGELDGKRILSEKAVQTMTSVQTGDLQVGFVDGMGWGLGWGVVRKSQGINKEMSPGAYGHGGAFGTQAWIDPKQGFFTILLIQRADLPNADASSIRGEFQTLVAEAMRGK
jgi:CubicO group peptidase (beta-lactamase class C family)